MSGSLKSESVSSVESRVKAMSERSGTEACSVNTSQYMIQLKHDLFACRTSTLFRHLCKSPARGALRLRSRRGCSRPSHWRNPVCRTRNSRLPLIFTPAASRLKFLSCAAASSCLAFFSSVLSMMKPCLRAQTLKIALSFAQDQGTYLTVLLPKLPEAERSP